MFIHKRSLQLLQSSSKLKSKLNAMPSRKTNFRCYCEELKEYKHLELLKEKKIMQFAKENEEELLHNRKIHMKLEYWNKILRDHLKNKEYDQFYVKWASFASNSNKIDVNISTTILEFFIETHNYDQSEKLLEIMIQNSVPLPLETINRYISFLSKDGLVDKINEGIDAMAKLNLKPNTMTIASAIRAHGRTSVARAKEAYDYYLKHYDIPIDINLKNAILDCHIYQNHSETKLYFNTISHRNSESYEIMCQYLSSSKEDLMHYFKMMRRDSVHPTKKIYNSILMNISNNHRYHDVLNIIEEMVHDGIEIDEDVLDNVCISFVEDDEAEKMESLYKMLIKNDILPMKTKYVEMICNAFCSPRVKESKKAYAWVIYMKKRNVEMSALVYSILMRGYSFDGSPDVALKLYETMIHEEKIVPNIATFLSLVSSQSFTEDPLFVLKILKSYKLHGVPEYAADIIEDVIGRYESGDARALDILYSYDWNALISEKGYGYSKN